MRGINLLRFRAQPERLGRNRAYHGLHTSPEAIKGPNKDLTADKFLPEAAVCGQLSAVPAWHLVVC